MNTAEHENKRHQHNGIERAMTLFDRIFRSPKLLGQNVTITSFLGENGSGMHISNRKNNKGVHITADKHTGDGVIVLGDNQSIPHPHSKPSSHLTPISYRESNLNQISSVAIDHLTS